MSTRRQFLSTSAAAAAAALGATLPAGTPASAAERAPALDAAAREGRSELRRYATMAAFAQAVPALDV